MVGSMHMRSRAAATTQSATGMSHHDDAVLSLPPRSIAEIVAATMVLAITASPPHCASKVSLAPPQGSMAKTMVQAHDPMDTIKF
ncbi:unnamed protein product [Prunus armeniaca]